MARPLTQKQVEKMLVVARKFVDASIDGLDSVTVGKVTHEPKEGGMCSRFIREVYQAATGRPAAGMFGNPATQTARLLRAAGFSIGDTSDLKPGDILYRSGGPGHVALYMGTKEPGHEGVEIIAENTSVGSRGFPRRPGTKYTRRGTGKGEFGSWREVFRLTKPGT